MSYIEKISSEISKKMFVLLLVKLARKVQILQEE